MPPHRGSVRWCGLALGILLVAAVVFCAYRPRVTVIDRRVTFDLVAIDLALDQFMFDCGRYPSTDEGLRALVSQPPIPGWQGPYVKGDENDPLVDQWGTPFGYMFQEGKAVVRSAGPDKEFDTQDDVSSRLSLGVQADKLGKRFGEK